MNTTKYQFPRKLNKLQTLAAAAVVLLVLAAVFWMVHRTGTHSRVQQYLELGEKYLTELDYEAAVVEFTNAIELDPRNTDAYLGRGDAYLGLGQYDQAVADFTFVADTLDQRNVDAHVGLAHGYAGQGDYDRAEEEVRRAEELGLSAEEAETLREEIRPPAPLTAAEVNWSMDPAYSYRKVVPLRGRSFSDLQGSFSDGQSAIPVGELNFYEMSFPGYSNLPQYYEVQLSDGTWHLYFMPQHLEGYAFAMSDPAETVPARYDADGIAGVLLSDENDINAYRQIPWHLLEGGGRGGSELALCYDTDTRQAFVVGSQYSYFLLPAAQAGLHKPYPAAAFSARSIGLDLTAQRTVEENAPQYEAFYALMEEARGTQTPKAYIGADGQPITDFVYEQTEDFSEGLAACCRNGKWGYIDETGRPVTDFVYDAVWEFRGEYDVAQNRYATRAAAYPCTSDTMVVWQNGQVGLLYRDGRTLIAFGVFEDMAPAYNDELWVKQDGLWGLVDLKDVKQKLRVDTELSCPADADVADPPYYYLEHWEEYFPDDVRLDNPATLSQEGPFFGAVSQMQRTVSAAPMYTGPGSTYEQKTVIPEGEPVSVYGGSRSAPEWLYVEWQERALTNPQAQSDFERYTTVPRYGWVQQQNLTPAS